MQLKYLLARLYQYAEGIPSGLLTFCCGAQPALSEAEVFRIRHLRSVNCSSAVTIKMAKINI
jgi:hypothetical protein